MQSVVVDANVFLSVIVHRNEPQKQVAKALLLKAEEGDLAVVLPQFVVFEIVYVLQSTYRLAPVQLAPMIRDLLALPGVLVSDECPWNEVWDLWPHTVVSLADAALLAVATSRRHDAVATFDRKLSKRLKEFGVAAYWP